MKVAVYRRSRFNAAHRLHLKGLSDDENKEIFGVCSNPNFHGHNYELFVKVVGEIDPKTGYVIDLKELNDLIDEKVIKDFDHHNLNLDIPEFEKMNPTAENIAIVIYNRIRPFIKSDCDLQIKLHETENNSVEYPAN